MPNGYTGFILHVDLTAGNLTVEQPPESFYRKYMGGSAMGMFYILRDMQSGDGCPGSRERSDLDDQRDDRDAHLRAEPVERQRQVPGQWGYRQFPVRRFLSG